MRLTTCLVQRLGLTDYGEALSMQRRLVDACKIDGRPRLLLLQHPPAYTLGARAKRSNILLDEAHLAGLGAGVHEVDRGGDVTFHGPGQLVGYPILDIQAWHGGPRWYVRSLEQILIDTLTTFGVPGRREPGRPGVWTANAKIAAIGVRISRGITSHGFALNVDPDLSYFQHIVPCGLSGVTVTSMARELGRVPDMAAVMDAVESSFESVFGLRMHTVERATTPVG